MASANKLYCCPLHASSQTVFSKCTSLFCYGCKLCSCKIFEHFVLQVDPVLELLQLRSIPFKDRTILAPKLADPPFWWKSLTPPLNLDPVYRSRSVHILYYLKMFVIEIQLLRNQISSCQQVCYYIMFVKCL
jgi:hypothetical protein